MRTIIAAICIALASCVLPGCTTLGTTGVSSALSPEAQLAQRAINETNVTLAAAANVIAQNLSDGVMTRAEAQEALNQVKEYAIKADDAQKLLDTGFVLDAKNQAELVKGLISTLHKQVAAKARKPL